MENDLDLYYKKKYLKYKSKYKNKKRQQIEQQVYQKGGGFQEYKERFVGKLKKATLTVHDALETGSYASLPESLLSIALD